MWTQVPKPPEHSTVGLALRRKCIRLVVSKQPNLTPPCTLQPIWPWREQNILRQNGSQRCLSRLLPHDTKEPVRNSCFSFGVFTTILASVMSLHSRVVLLSLAYAVTVAQAFVPTVGARDDSHLTNALHSDGVSGFNAFAKDNLAVYYGLQSRGQSTLASLCQEQDADIAILPFVKQFNGLNQVPYFSFTWDCSYNGTGSPAGLNCANFAANITYCQSLGTKVFVSVGGASSNTTFASANDASNAASTLWNIFGAGTATPSLRPFANITVDGFDFGKQQS